MIRRAMPLAFQIILLAFALPGAAKIWKETYGYQGSTLIRVLIQDQILYFAAYVTLNDNTIAEHGCLLTSSKGSYSARQLRLRPILQQ